MSNKKHPVSKTTNHKTNGSRGRNRNKQGQHKKNTNKDDVFLELSSNYNDADKQTKQSIMLLFVSALAVIGAVMYQHHTKRILKLASPASSSTHFTSKNTNSSSKKKTSLSELFRAACGKTKLAYCSTHLFEIHDESRSIRARISARKNNKEGRIIKTGQKLLEIPRTVQRTTIDALRDPRVNQLLRQNPRHPTTGKALRPQAYLVVYMALELSGLRSSSSSASSLKSLSSEEQLQRAYLDFLPTYQDFVGFHPILMHLTNNNDGVADPPPSTYLARHLTDQWLRLFESEYHALCQTSSDFADLVSLEDWIASCLIVSTRSFESVPLTQNDISDKELESYRPFLRDFAEDQERTNNSSSSSAFYDSCRNTLMRSCMVPLLDALDHHVKPNVGWKFLNDSQSDNNAAPGELQSFIAFAVEDVESGADLFDSYGSALPDPMIFAQYGFVNSDRSGRRAALLAPYHRLIDEEFETKPEQYHDYSDLQRYLAFEDGYESCSIDVHEDSDDTQRLEFQQAKFLALQTISNVLKSWIVSVPPPNSGEATLPELDDGSFDVLSMCRLLATTHRDYGGRATKLLGVVATADNPGHYRFGISTDERSSGGLEYRTWHVLERLATDTRSNMLRSLIVSSSSSSTTRSTTTHSTDIIGTDTDWMIEVDLRHKLEHEIDRNSAEWGTNLVLLGELDTLSILREHAERMKRVLQNQKKKAANNSHGGVNEEDYIVRIDPCEQL